jgi:hypothetical protein
VDGSAAAPLWRIDPAHAVVHPVQSDPLGAVWPSHPSPDAWVTQQQRRRDGVKVSTVTNRAVAIRSATSVATAAGSGGVWVANEGDYTVDRIDP